MRYQTKINHLLYMNSIQMKLYFDTQFFDCFSTRNKIIAHKTYPQISTIKIIITNHSEDKKWEKKQQNKMLLKTVMKIGRIKGIFVRKKLHQNIYFTFLLDIVVLYVIFNFSPPFLHVRCSLTFLFLFTTNWRIKMFCK